VSLLELRGVSKRYGGVHALRGADLSVDAGEVRALVGENGSGKSTLMKILSGQVRQDSGEVDVDGVVLPSGDAASRPRHGVGAVMQEPAVCPNLTVAENLFVGRLPGRGGRVAWGELYRRAEAVLAEAGIALDGRTVVGRLSQDDEHMTEVARVIAQDCRVIAFDETTASLTEDQVQRLFRIIRARRDAGAAVVFITHRLSEVFALCDSVTILRDGEVMGTRAVAGVTEQEVVRLMVGRTLEDQFFRPPAAIGDVRLKLDGVRPAGMPGTFGLEVRAGEVLGIGGLVASGRTTLLHAVYGLCGREGEVTVDGRTVRRGAPAAAIRGGIGLVPEDRRRQGLAMEQSVRDNAALLRTAQHGLLTRASRRDDDAAVARLRAAVALKAPDPAAPVRTLSGGNQQKIVLGRWLERPPAVLLLDEPTRGIDVGAKREIYDLIHGLAEAGTAVVLVSSELPELMGLADRILVLHEGRPAREFPRGVTDQELGEAMTGVAATA
jgi:ABC-type sugar transport system ATPase subunit